MYTRSLSSVESETKDEIETIMFLAVVQNVMVYVVIKQSRMLCKVYCDLSILDTEYSTKGPNVVLEMASILSPTAMS